MDTIKSFANQALSKGSYSTNYMQKNTGLGGISSKQNSCNEINSSGDSSQYKAFITPDPSNHQTFSGHLERAEYNLCTLQCKNLVRQESSKYTRSIPYTYKSKSSYLAELASYKKTSDYINGWGNFPQFRGWDKLETHEVQTIMDDCERVYNNFCVTSTTTERKSVIQDPSKASTHCNKVINETPYLDGRASHDKSCNKTHGSGDSSPCKGWGKLETSEKQRNKGYLARAERKPKSHVTTNSLKRYNLVSQEFSKDVNSTLHTDETKIPCFEKLASIENPLNRDGFSRFKEWDKLDTNDLDTFDENFEQVYQKLYAERKHSVSGECSKATNSNKDIHKTPYSDGLASHDKSCIKTNGSVDSLHYKGWDKLETSEQHKFKDHLERMQYHVPDGVEIHTFEEFTFLSEGVEIDKIEGFTCLSFTTEQDLMNYSKIQHEQT